MDHNPHLGQMSPLQLPHPTWPQRAELRAGRLAAATTPYDGNVPGRLERNHDRPLGGARVHADLRVDVEQALFAAGRPDVVVEELGDVKVRFVEGAGESPVGGDLDVLVSM